MARRRKNDATTQNDTSMQDWNRSLGYSDKSLKALESGTYGQLTNRKSTSMKSEDQARIANPTPLPVLEGMNTNNSDWESSFGRAKQYQKNLENEEKKYQYNESAAQRNSLDEKDQGYLQRLVDRFGDGDLVRSSLSESKKNEWEQKYGKSIDRIYADFMADQDNAKMRQGQEHSVLSTISSTLGSALSPLTALPSLAANIIDPDSETAKTLEKTRADYSKQRKLLRAGVKENLGDTGDKIYDTATQIGDRMVNAAAGKVLGGKLGGALMTGLSDADQQMDELNLRPGMSGRKKAASALAHGAVEGAGTAIELNALGNLPEVGGIGGRLINVGRGALSGAGENMGAEILENMLDTRIGGENSRYQLNKALYMLNGMSEEDATKQADSDQTKQVAMAGLMGGIFGGGMKGISEFADSLKKDKIPSLWTPDNKPVDTSDIDDTIAKPKSSGDPYRVPEGWTAEDLENSVGDASKVKNKAMAESTDTFQYVTTDGKYTLIPTDNGWEIKGADGTSSKVKGGFDKAKSQLDDIYKTTGAETIPDVVPQKRMPASERYSIQTVYAEDGSPRYFVRENVSDTGSRPVEPGKVYKTADEAQKALDNLKSKAQQIPETEPEVVFDDGRFTITKNGNDFDIEDKAGTTSIREGSLENAKQQIEGIYEAEADSTSAPEGIQVYRGYNRSNNPLETNLAKQKSIYDVLGKEDPNKVDMLPLEYYTDNLDDAQMYANHDKTFYENLRNSAKADLIRAYERGENIPDEEAFIKNSMDESYRILTGREPLFENGHVDTHTINPQNVLDLSELGETTSVDAIYNYLSKVTGLSPSEIDDVLRFSSLEQDEVGNILDIPTYSVLRNKSQGEGAFGSRFVDFMRNNGYDAVKYRESGANHYALLNDGNNTKVTPAEIPTEEVPNILPTASNGGLVPPEPPEPPKGPETDISRRYETLKNSDLFQKSEANMKMLETAKEKGVFNKDIESRAKAQADALKEFTEDPTKAINDNLDKQWTSGKDLDTSMLVLNDALDSGSQAYANLVMLKQAQQTKNAGRVLRAALDYAKRNYAGTKESTLQEAAKFLNDKADALLKNRKTAEQFDAIAQRIMNGDLSDLNTRFNMDDVNIQNIKDALEAGAGKTDIAHMIAMYQSVGKTGISADALQKVTDIYNQIQAQNLKPNSRARANLETDAFKVLADDIGGKRNWKDMWDSWRYLAMLGNPKTHLRNLLGNATHYMVTEAKDNIGAVIEGAVDKANRAAGREGIERTKAVLTAKDRGLVKAGEVDADDVAYAALNDSGNKYNVKNEIERAMSSFNNKALSRIDELNSNLLDLEDYSALKRKYSKSLARFLKANGADESIFKATDDASKELLDKGRAYAIDQAKQATFHEYSQLANALNTLSKNLRESDNLGTKAAGVAVEGLVPFKKTPINILKQAGKYSPISLATGVKKAFDAVKTGNSTAAEAIEDLSAGMTGSMIMGLGAFLAHEGYLTGGANADYTVDNAETEQGAQNYALKIGDNSYTLDWLAPMALPLFVGAELMRESENGGEGDALDRVISSISTIAEPITEMSMLQGIQNILNELSYSKENVIATLGTNATLGYATQGIPTLFGQIARAADDTRRSTYTDQPAGYKRQVDKTITKTLNKLPFVSMASQPYVDSSGNEQQNEGLATALLGNNFGTRLADQMLSPGYFKQGTITETDKELNRLYEATGENVYKDIASGKIGNNPDKISKENFTKYQKLYGSNNDYLYDEIIKTDAYKNLDDAEKVKTLDALKSASKMIADHEIGGKELKKSEQTVYDIYKSQGKKGLLKYFEDKATAESLGMKYDEYIKKESETPGGAEQWAADKQAAEELGFVNKDGRVDTSSYQKAIGQAGDMSQKFISDLPVLQDLGLERSAYYTYANAINEIPSLTPSEFAQTYEEINTNPNNAITQKELLDYINSFEYDDPSEAEDLWYAYGGWTKKDGTPKKLKWDGKKFVAYY